MAWLSISSLSKSQLKTRPIFLASTILLLSPPSGLALNYSSQNSIFLADAAPTLKMEKPLVDTSAPKVTPPASPPAQYPQQSPSGYVVPPEVMSSGAPQYQQGQPPSGGYGNSAMQGGGAPQFPNENAIPEFGKPLPSVPPTMSNTYQGGPGWGTGPTQNSDEARVGRLEKSVLGSMYPEHEIDERVEHLEEELYKAKGTGPMDVRIRKMEASVFGSSAAFGASNAVPQAAPYTPGARTGAPSSSTPTPSHAPYEMAPYRPQSPGSSTAYVPTASAAVGSQASSGPNIYGTPDGNPPPGSYPAPGNYPAQSPYPSQGSYPAQPAYPQQGTYPPTSGYGAPLGYNKPQGMAASGLAPQGGQSQGGYRPYLSPPGQAPYQQPQQAPSPYNPGYGQAPGGYPGNGGAMRPGPGYPPQANQYSTGNAPYTPPGGGYGAPQSGYPGNGSGGGYGAQGGGGFPRVPPGGMPGNISGNMPGNMPGGIMPQPNFVPDAESQKVLSTINSDPRAGDYYATVRKFQAGNVARWQHFPVLIHLPPNTPELCGGIRVVCH